jgi:pimeloyl-ACP methyl ester carboxylesterase
LLSSASHAPIKYIIVFYSSMYYFNFTMASWQWDVGFAFAFVVFLLLAGFFYELIGERRDAERHPAPGRLVSVGDHKLHLLGKGSAVPAVVIEMGAGEASHLWWPVQDQIAEFASVCTYDRAGYGWSEATRAGRTIDDRGEELHTLLTNAGIAGPYIFVAHSYGGLVVRSLAQNHPDEVAGLVLVDTPEEAAFFQPEVLDLYAKARLMNRVVAFGSRFGVLRLLRHWIPLDRFGFWLRRPAEYAALCDDLASLELVPMSMRSSEKPGNLGALPVGVITHGQPFPGPFAILEKNWSQGQTRLTALSNNSQLIVARNSNHMVEIDEPHLVVDMVQRVHAAVRNHTVLGEIGAATAK